MTFLLRKGVVRHRNTPIALILIVMLSCLPFATSSLTKNLTIESSGTVNYEPPPEVSFVDNFADAVIDSFWSKVEVGAGVATEQNGHLECNIPSDGISGLVSADPLDLSTCDIQVDVNIGDVRMQALMVSLSKVNTSDPWGQPNWYAIQRRTPGSELRVQKRVGSTLTTIYSALWSSGIGSLRITINAGTIHFCEDDIEVYNESYALADYDCYVYIYSQGDEGHYGMSYFDNFSLTAVSPPPPPPPPTPPPIITPPLHIEGRYIRDDMGNKVFLRGTTIIHFLDDPSGKMDWGNWVPATVQANLDAMVSWGINVLRIHTCVEWWLNNYQGYRDNLKDVIQLAGERGMYVIFECWSISHLYSGWPGKDPLPYPPYNNYPEIIGSKQDFVDYWTNVSTELKDYPNVLFEIFCEPHPPDGNQSKIIRDEFFDVVEDCINAIRAAGSDAICIVQWGQLLWTSNPTYWTANMYWVEEQLDRGILTDTNLVFNGHIYRYHGSFGSMLGNVSYAYILEKMQGFQIPYVLDTLNKSVICCETGAFHYGSSEYDNELECLRNELSIMNEWGMSYVVFAWGDTAFNIINGSESGGSYDTNPSGQVLIDAIAPSI